MARGDFTLFEAFAENIGAGDHALDTGVLKMGIVTDALTPLANVATPTWTTYSGGEVSDAGGYTIGGETLANVVYDQTAGVATLDSDAVSLVQNGAGFTDAYWGILYNDTATSDEAIGFVELGGPVSEQTGDITITPDPDGWFTLTIV